MDETKRMVTIYTIILVIAMCALVGILAYTEHIENKEMEQAVIYIENGYFVVIDGIKVAPEEIDSAGLHSGIYGIHDIDKETRTVYLNRKTEKKTSTVVPIIIPRG